MRLVNEFTRNTYARNRSNLLLLNNVVAEYAGERRCPSKCRTCSSAFSWGLHSSFDVPVCNICSYVGRFTALNQRNCFSDHRRRQNLYVLQFHLTFSPPIPLRLYTLPYWSNPSFLIFDIRALWRSGLSARAPECQKLNDGLDQHGTEPIEQQQFGTAGAESVKHLLHRFRQDISS